MFEVPLANMTARFETRVGHPEAMEFVEHRDHKYAFTGDGFRDVVIVGCGERSPWLTEGVVRGGSAERLRR